MEGDEANSNKNTNGGASLSTFGPMISYDILWCPNSGEFCEMLPFAGATCIQNPGWGFQKHRNNQRIAQTRHVALVPQEFHFEGRLEFLARPGNVAQLCTPDIAKCLMCRWFTSKNGDFSYMVKQRVYRYTMIVWSTSSIGISLLEDWLYTMSGHQCGFIKIQYTLGPPQQVDGRVKGECLAGDYSKLCQDMGELIILDDAVSPGTV